ncbi:heat shock protein beta-7-like [Clavelina lepadiformis]|uniref:SHSP domain-containing protein n=1 Tax=Clavelina lepadiformis TaxID=159417 RepID=A0ABP0GY90_CLALP
MRIIRGQMTPRQQWSMSVRVGDFLPEDIIVKAVNHRLEVRAEKVAVDGNSEAEFSHKCQLPNEVDATSISTQLYRDGTLVLRADWKPGTL